MPIAIYRKPHGWSSSPGSSRPVFRDTRKNPDIEGRVEPALKTDREVRDFFEGERTLIFYELKIMLLDRANDLD